jgi:hypothetical protein
MDEIGKGMWNSLQIEWEGSARLTLQCSEHCTVQTCNTLHAAILGAQYSSECI